VSFLDLDQLGERRLIAEHAVDALDHDQLGLALIAETGQAPVEVVGVVVTETHHRGTAEPAAVVDARVGIGIHQDDIAWSGEARQHAQIRLIPRREHQRTAPPHEAGDLALEFAVKGISAVGDPRACGPGAVFPDRSDCSVRACGIESESQVVVGAHEDSVPTVDASPGRGHDLIDAHPEGIGASLDDLAVASRNQRVLVENVHEFSVSRSVGAPPLADPAGSSSPTRR
jgi:hypothetical protein